MKNNPKRVLNDNYFSRIYRLQENGEISHFMFLGNYKEHDLYTWKHGITRYFGAKNLKKLPNMTFSCPWTGGHSVWWLKEAYYRYKELR